MSQDQKDAVDALMRAAPLDIGGDLAVQRGVLDQIMRAHPLPDDVRVTPTSAGGVPAVHIAAGEVSEEAVIFYLHGGAYTMGSAEAGAGLAAGLGRAAGVAVTSIDYRLAPEHPFPSAFEDAVSAYRGLLDAGTAPEAIIVAGESAGAGLAAALLASLGTQGLAQPAGAVLISPWADLTLSGQSLDAKAAIDPALSAAGLSRRVEDYLQGADPATPQASPIFADLTGVAPLLIQVGSHEILLDDSVRLAARAAAADVAVTLEVVPGVPHVFPSFAGMLEEADAAIARAGSFMRSQLWATTPTPTSERTFA